MKKKVGKKEEITNKDLAQMLKGIGANIVSLDTKVVSLDTKVVSLDTKVGSLDTKVGGLDTKINNLGKNLDIRITRLENYMKEGFNLLDNKIEHVDARLSSQIEGLGRRMDDFADNKVSRIHYKELESRVMALESRVLPKIKK